MRTVEYDSSLESKLRTTLFIVFLPAPYGHKDIMFGRVTVVLHISQDVLEFLGRC